MILFFDCEVLNKYWCVVAIVPHTEKEEIHVIDNRDELLKFYEKHTNSVWVGYNSRHYDQYIIKGILLDMNPYEISQHIISKNLKGYQYSSAFTKLQLYNFDIKTTPHSLKELEGFMGNNIQESSVSFELQRELTEVERSELITYCIHDVKQTIEVFKNRKEEFDSQISLLKAFQLPLKSISKTKAQLSAMILDSSLKSRNDEFNIKIPDTVIINNPEYQEIKEWYFKTENQNYLKNQKVNIYNTPCILGFGGIHGAIDNCKYEGLLVNFDIASMYPALMIEYDFLSRNVYDKKKYRQIRDTRLELKRKKDPMQAPYKIVLNY